MRLCSFNMNLTYLLDFANTTFFFFHIRLCLTDFNKNSYMHSVALATLFCLDIAGRLKKSRVFCVHYCNFVSQFCSFQLLLKMFSNHKFISIIVINQKDFSVQAHTGTF